MLRSRPTIDSTTRSSISVNPQRRFMFMASPVLVRPSVAALSGREREHVEDVGAVARLVGVARVAALAPGRRGRERRVRVERIARNAAQEKDLLALGALLVLHALGELLERLRVAGLVDRLLHAALVPRELVGVDGVADLAQVAAQLALLLAPHGELGDRERGRREQRDDRDRDHALDQGEACMALDHARSFTVWARRTSAAAAAARRRTAPWC